MQPLHDISPDAEMTYRQNRIAEQFRREGARGRSAVSTRFARHHWIGRNTRTS